MIGKQPVGRTMKKKPPDYQDIIRRVTLLHYELHQAGLHATAHQMHRVVQEIGFEVAGVLDKKQKAVHIKARESMRARRSE